MTLHAAARQRRARFGRPRTRPHAQALILGKWMKADITLIACRCRGSRSQSNVFTHGIGSAPNQNKDPQQADIGACRDVSTWLCVAPSCRESLTPPRECCLDTLSLSGVQGTLHLSHGPLSGRPIAEVCRTSVALFVSPLGHKARTTPSAACVGDGNVTWHRQDVRGCRWRELNEQIRVLDHMRWEVCSHRRLPDCARAIPY